MNLADLKTRLAHGRVAQTILVALTVCIENLHILASWEQTNTPPGRVRDTTSEQPQDTPAEIPPPRSRPPPAEL